jgi:hypothetical protein
MQRDVLYKIKTAFTFLSIVLQPIHINKMRIIAELTLRDKDFSTGPILDRKHAEDVCQLRENDKIGARLETYPRKALVQLAHQMGVCIINTFILSGNEA